MYCENCGNKLRDGAAFCPKCGATVDPDDISITDQEKKIEPVYDTEIKSTVEERSDKTDSLIQNNIAEKQNQNKKYKKTPIIITIASVLSVIVVCLVVFLLLPNLKNNTSDNANAGDTVNESIGETNEVKETEQPTEPPKSVLEFTDDKHQLSGDFIDEYGDIEFASWDEFVSKYPQVADPMSMGQEYSDKMHITILLLKDNEGNRIDARGVMNATGFGNDPCDWKNRFGEFDWIYSDNYGYEEDNFYILYEDEYYSGPADCNVIIGKLREYVTFGSYEQDGDETNGKEPIEWIVLTQDDEKMLVVSKYCLDYLRYPDDWSSNIVWETSYIRKHLNSEFFDDAFSNEEKQEIILSANPNKASEDYYSTVDGNSTEDWVFLLSIDEVQTYLPNSTSSETSTTAYGTDYLYDVLRQHIYYTNLKDNESVEWALRADIDTSRNEEKVGMPREINASSRGIYMSLTTGGMRDPDGPLSVIRPAMWIKKTVQKNH